MAGQIILSNRLRNLQAAAQGFGDSLVAQRKVQEDEKDRAEERRIRALQLQEAEAQAGDRERIRNQTQTTDSEIRTLRGVENHKLPDFNMSPVTTPEAPTGTGVDLGSLGGKTGPMATPDIGVQALQMQGQKDSDIDLKDTLLSRIRSAQTGSLITKDDIRKQRESQGTAESRATQLFDLDVKGKNLSNQKTEKELSTPTKADYSNVDVKQLDDGTMILVDKKSGTWKPLVNDKGEGAKGVVTGGKGKNPPIPLAEAEEKARQTIGVIDQMIGRAAKGKPGEPGYDAGVPRHPGFKAAVGSKLLSGSYGFGTKDEPLAGTSAADFEALLNQVKGTAFLEAFQSLKGGGAITEVEGSKATQAITRMDKSQSPEAFIQAAQEFKDIVERGLDRRRKMEGTDAATALDDIYGGEDLGTFLNGYKGTGGKK